MNLVVIMGTMTRDPELRYSKSGAAIVNFSIAVNKKFKGKDGEMQEKVSFFDVSAFNRPAEIINQFFSKGSRILIRGELEQQTWTTNDGSKRSRIVIVMSEFDFIDRKEQGGGSNNGGQQYQQPQQSPQQHGYRQPDPQYQRQVAPSSTPPIPEVEIEDEEIPF